MNRTEGSPIGILNRLDGVRFGQIFILSLYPFEPFLCFLNTLAGTLDAETTSMSSLWAAAAAFVLMASFYCRLLLFTKFSKVVGDDDRFRWVGRVLLGLMILAGGCLLVLTRQARI